MALCEYASGCPFFNDKMAKRPTTAGLLKQEYCENNSSKCARLIIREKLGADKVPADLYPNRIDKVKELIENL